MGKSIKKQTRRPTIPIRLTYECNNKCKYCYEDIALAPRGFMTEETFDGALKLAKRKGYSRILLFGGEPSLHPKLIHFAKKAKQNGFQIIMFTNFSRPGIIKELDSVLDALDNIIISYHDAKISLPKQIEFNSKLTLSTLIYKGRFKTKEDLDKFIDDKKDLGLHLDFRTLMPATQWAADNQFVDFLEELYHKTPIENRSVFNGCETITYRNCMIKFNNKVYNFIPIANIDMDGKFHKDHIRKEYKPQIKTTLKV